MRKQIVIAGCRDYENYTEAKAYIEACIAEMGGKASVVFLSGGCRGADMLGERFAKENDIPVIRYCAEWRRYGKRAGLKRNLQMAKDCDYIICFWDGKSRGTASMIAYAREMNKQLKIIRI